MEARTVKEAQRSPLLTHLPEYSPVPSSSLQGSSIDPLHSIHPLLSFESGHEPLDLHLTSSFPKQKAASPAAERQRSVIFKEEKEHQRKTTSERSTRPSTWGTLCFGWWTFEILAFSISFASLAVIIVMLKHFDGHPQPDWPQYITLNSVLSWFTTLYKTNLLVPIASCFGQASWLHYRAGSHPLADLALYDSASRGPLGSLQLLRNFKTKYVASIGAIATILALGVDPIVQQTLSIRLNVLEAINNATLGRAQSFLQWDIQDYSVRQDLSPGVNGDSDPDPSSHVLLPPPEMVAAMFDGMFSGDGGPTRLTSGPSLFCPTGNCTFQPFQTLAVCSRCENITDALNHTCSFTAAGSVQGPPGVSTLCEYTTSNNLKMNRTFGPNTVSTSCSLPSVGPPPYPQSILNFTGIWSGESPYYGADGPPYDIIEMGKAQVAALSTNGVTATQCFLYWCVQTMLAKVVNGRIEETVNDTWFNRTTTPPNRDFKTFAVSVPSNEVVIMQPPPPEPEDTSSRFLIARHASEALADWLIAHLTVTTSRNWGDFGSSSDVFNVNPEYENERLLLSANITKMFENIAASMTNTLRNTRIEDQSSNPAAGINVSNAGLAIGTATSHEVVVSVHWPWLAFPIILFLIALSFFVLILLSTSRHRMEVWKASPFPLTFNRVDESQPTPQSEILPVGKCTRIEDMQHKAASVTARLEDWDVGPRLTSHIGHVPHGA